jgi:hypothetical protein
MGYPEAKSHHISFVHMICCHKSLALCAPPFFKGGQRGFCERLQTQVKQCHMFLFR